MENTDNFIIDLNGSVYKGDFQDYWKQAFGIGMMIIRRIGERIALMRT